MINMFLFIKRNRARKKLKVYKQAALISLDFTTIFYVALFMGYILFSIIAEGNFISNMQDNFAFLKDIEIRNFSYILIVLPVFYLLTAFSQPGVAFSSTEYKLTIQPVKKLHLWWLLVTERWLRRALVYVMIGLVYGLLSATSAKYVVLYVLLLLLLNIIMTPIQWKFFQLPLWQKVACLFLLVLVDTLVFITDILFVVILVTILLLIFSIISIQKLMKKINWQKTTAAVDFKMWNMALISRLTKVKFQKPRKYTIWQYMPFYKRSFHPRKNTVYHRLWQLHFEKNKVHILQLSGILLIFLFVTVFLKQWLFLIAVFVTTQIYSELMAALFKDRFREDIVAILPWDVTAYRDTFHLWAFLISGIYLIPGIIYVVKFMSTASIVHIILFGLFFVLQLLETLNKQLHLMDKSMSYKERILQLCAVGMIFTFLSHFHMFFLYLAVGTALILLVNRRRPLS